MADGKGLITNYGVSGGGAVGLILQASATALKFELSAAEEDGISKTISNPRVFTLDNEEAVIIQGDKVPVESSADGGGTNTEYLDAGVTLTVTPSIVGDGNIILDVNVTKDTPNYTITPPPITTKEIKTKLLIKDGTIVVIGGVYTQEAADSVSKVPFFGDIPIIGRLFKKETKKDNRKELLIFLAPRVI